MTTVFWRFLVLWGLLALQLSISEADERKSALSENEAVQLLVQKVKADSLYDNWTKIECLNFLVEEATQSHVDIVIREKHGGKCPGDPNTAPEVDRFRVLCSTKKVLWWDFATGDYSPYEKGKAWRKK